LELTLAVSGQWLVVSGHSEASCAFINSAAGCTIGLYLFEKLNGFVIPQKLPEAPLSKMDDFKKGAILYHNDLSSDADVDGWKVEPVPLQRLYRLRLYGEFIAATPGIFAAPVDRAGLYKLQLYYIFP